jgi:hypothetical protein
VPTSVLYGVVVAAIGVQVWLARKTGRPLAIDYLGWAVFFVVIGVVVAVNGHWWYALLAFAVVPLNARWAWQWWRERR